jgi:hypothetical protein
MTPPDRRPIARPALLLTISATVTATAELLSEVAAIPVK